MSLNIVRTCRCLCGKTFTPPASRPGQEYIHGHRPRSGTSPATAKHEARNEAAESLLNYRLTLRIAERDKRLLDARIEAIDDEMGKHRDAIATLQAAKDALMPKHETTAALAIVLEEAIQHAQKGTAK